MEDAVIYAINYYKIQDTEVKNMRGRVRKILAEFVQIYHVPYRYKNGRWIEIRHVLELVARTINPETMLHDIGTYGCADRVVQSLIYNDKLSRLDSLIVTTVAATSATDWYNTMYNKCNTMIRSVRKTRCIPLYDGIIINSRFRPYKRRDYVFKWLPLKYTEPVSHAELIDFLHEETGDPDKMILFIRNNIVHDVNVAITFTNYDSSKTYPILQVILAIYGNIFNIKRANSKMFIAAEPTKISGQLMLRRYFTSNREPFKIKLRHNESLSVGKARAIAIALCVAASVNIEKKH